MIRRAALFGLGLLALSAAAARGEIPPPHFTAGEYLLTRLGQGHTRESFIGQLVQPMAEHDRLGDGIDEADILGQERREWAERRGQTIGSLLIYDLDGDGNVDRAEILAVPRRGDAERNAQEMLQRFDADGDDRVTQAEMFGWPGETQYSYYRNHLRALLAMDPDRDGHITADEVTALATPVFARLDADRDGTISEKEADAFEPQRTAAGQAVARALGEISAPRCPLPAVPRSARLILVGSYESESLSSVAIGGENRETHHVEVRIEPGSQPLYLVLTAYESTLWQVTGDTDRVAAVVVDSFHSARGGYAASGVAGIAPERVGVQRGRCLVHFTSADQGEVWRNVGAIRLATGRRPDAIFASHRLSRVTLPAGEIEVVRENTSPPERPVPPGFDSRLWRDALGYWPRGVVQVDPRQAVSPAGVVPYRVLPSQAGLAQLVGSGAVVRDATGQFRIVRPIPHIPPGLAGGHRVIFVLARGVPVPPGDLAHSCMIVEDTGERLGNSTLCRQ